MKFVVVILAFLAVLSTAQNAPGAFSGYTFLQGDWHITEFALSEGSFQRSKDVLTTWSFAKQNGTQNLLGRSFDNDTTTGDISNELVVLVEFDGVNDGVFKVGAADSTEETALFEFKFSELSNGVVLSVGAWGADATYQFSVSGWDRFTITIQPKDGPLRLLVAKKVPMETEKTFWAKYGTWVMMGGMITLNMFLQNRTRTSQMREAQTAAARQRRAAAGAAAGAAGAEAAAAGAEEQPLVEGEAEAEVAAEGDHAKAD